METSAVFFVLNFLMNLPKINRDIIAKRLEQVKIIHVGIALNSNS
jgi:hypothetical protein